MPKKRAISIPKGCICAWCKKEDLSVGYVVADKTTCLSCKFIRDNLADFLTSKESKKFTRKTLNDMTPRKTPKSEGK